MQFFRDFAPNIDNRYKDKYTNVPFPYKSRNFQIHLQCSKIGGADTANCELSNVVLSVYHDHFAERIVTYVCFFWLLI